MTITRQKLKKDEEIQGSDPNFTYKIVECLDEGYYGIVYKGKEVLSGDVVAIKEYFPTDLARRDPGNSVVPEPLTNSAVFDENLKTFKKEAVLLDKIRKPRKHPNIVTCYDSTDAYETAYIVMEYVEGQNLSDYLSSKKVLQEEELKSILCPLLDALEWIHGKKIFHRDIKPANIILRQDEENKVPVLVDFGAAQEGGGNRQPLICTYEYAPPELRNNGLTGPYTDIYELGMVCYEALTGKLPPKPRGNEKLELDWGGTEDVSEEFKKSIEEALKQDYKKRPDNVQKWRESMKPPSPPEPEQKGVAEKEMIEQSPSAPEQKETAPVLPPTKPSEKPLPKKSLFMSPFRPLILGVVVVLCVVGILVGIYFEEQQAELKRQQEQQAELKRRQAMQEELDRFREEVRSDDIEPTPTGKVAGEPHLYIVARLNLPTITFFLLAEGADIYAKKEDDHLNRTVLHVAAQWNASKAVEVLLDKGGADVYAKDNDGKTVLHVAAQRNASKAVGVLLDKGAEVNAKDNDGKTPLHYLAAWRSASEVVGVLLDKGAEVNAKDNDGKTPLHVAAWRDVSAVAKVLLDKGAADVNAIDNDGNTPLHTAAERGSYVVVRELLARMILRRELDIKAKNNDGKTALDLTSSPLVKEQLEPFF